MIPGNDDALRAVRLFASRIADAVLEGQQMLTEGGAAVEEPAAKEQSEAEKPAATSEIESPTAEPAGEESAGLETVAAVLPPASDDTLSGETGSQDETQNENAEVVAAS